MAVFVGLRRKRERHAARLRESQELERQKRESLREEQARKARTQKRRTAKRLRKQELRSQYVKLVRYIKSEEVKERQAAQAAVVAQAWRCRSGQNFVPLHLRVWQAGDKLAEKQRGAAGDAGGK